MNLQEFIVSQRSKSNGQALIIENSEESLMLLIKLTGLLKYPSYEDMLEEFHTAEYSLELCNSLELIIYWLEHYPNELTKLRYNGRTGLQAMTRFEALSKFIGIILNAIVIVSRSTVVDFHIGKKLLELFKGRFDILHHFVGLYIESKLTFDIGDLEFLNSLIPFGKILVFNVSGKFMLGGLETCWAALLNNKEILSDAEFRKNLNGYFLHRYSEFNFQESFYECIRQPGCILLHPNLRLLYILVKNNVAGLFKIQPTTLDIFPLYRLSVYVEQQLINAFVSTDMSMLSHPAMIQQKILCKVIYLPNYANSGIYQLSSCFPPAESHFQEKEKFFFNMLLSCFISRNSNINIHGVLHYFQWLQQRLSIEQRTFLLSYSEFFRLNRFMNERYRMFIEKAIHEKVFPVTAQGHLLCEMNLFMELPEWLPCANHDIAVKLLTLPCLKLFDLNTPASYIFCSPFHLNALSYLLRAATHHDATRLLEAFFVSHSYISFYRAELTLRFLLKYPFLFRVEYAQEVHNGSVDCIRLLSDEMVSHVLLEKFGANNPQFILNLLQNQDLSVGDVWNAIDSDRPVHDLIPPGSAAQLRLHGIAPAAQQTTSVNRAATANLNNQPESQGRRLSRRFSNCESLQNYLASKRC